MDTSKKPMVYICSALGALVVVLLVVIGVLLGQRGSGKHQNTTAPVASVEADASASEAQPGESQLTAADAQNTTAPFETQTDAATQAPNTAQTVNAPKNLDISMSAGSLTFVSGSAFDIKYDSSVIDVSYQADSVTIENAHSHPTASERRRMDVTVTVPENYAFEDVDIEMGAGKMIVHSLMANALDLELGAGSATFDQMVITGSAEIQEGAGELSIKGGSINNLTLQCGAGATRVTAALKGASRIDAAFGAVDLKFDGSEADYTVAFQMGLGACYYNNEKISRNGSFGTGPNTVNITGGFGVMRVNVG